MSSGPCWWRTCSRGPGALACSPSESFCRTALSTATSPSTSSSASNGSPPGRRSRGGVTVRSMMVLSTPTEQGPPSTMPSILPSMSSSICWAVVGLGRPEVLPLGAATGMPDSRMMASVMVWSGQRTPTVSSPPVVRRGTLSRRGRIMVSGPGQKRSASA